MFFSGSATSNVNSTAHVVGGISVDPRIGDFRARDPIVDEDTAAITHSHIVGVVVINPAVEDLEFALHAGNRSAIFGLVVVEVTAANPQISFEALTL